MVNDQVFFSEKKYLEKNVKQAQELMIGGTTTTHQ
jgi:hypothetical protein